VPVELSLLWLLLLQVLQLLLLPSELSLQHQVLLHPALLQLQKVGASFLLLQLLLLLPLANRHAQKLLPRLLPLALPRSTLLALVALCAALVVLTDAAPPTVLAVAASLPMLTNAGPSAVLAIVGSVAVLASRCSRHRLGEVAGGAIVVLGLLLVGDHEDPTASLDTDGESAQEL